MTVTKHLIENYINIFLHLLVQNRPGCLGKMLSLAESVHLQPDGIISDVEWFLLNAQIALEELCE